LWDNAEDTGSPIRSIFQGNDAREKQTLNQSFDGTPPILWKKGNISLNDTCQGFPVSKKRESVKRMVEHGRSKGGRSWDSIKLELDLPEIKLSTLTFIDFLGDEHFMVALVLCATGLPHALLWNNSTSGRM